MEKRKSNIRMTEFLQLLLVLTGIVVINVIGSYLFTRVDLTSEKRYTLSDASKEILTNLDDIVFFKVYLEGDFPAGFKRLKKETIELLDEFRAYNKNIQYEFIDPSADDDQQERNDTYQLLMQQGLTPTNLQVPTNSGLEQQVIFPGTLISYRNSEVAVELLDAQINQNISRKDVLNNSVENLEFKFANAIYHLTQNTKPRIAFIEGHGELSLRETFDLTNTLQSDYLLERISLEGNINALVVRTLADSINEEYNINPKYSAIIIAKPDSVISEKDKFIIDQYIMHGGKALWLIDPVLTSMDSIQAAESTVAIENNLNLQDMFFSYGVRMNQDLIMDLSAARIPVRTGQMGNQPQIDFFPWYYFPVVTPSSSHPIVKNLNAIKTQFVSSLDTVASANVRKTILLKTSPYSRKLNVPAMVSLAIIGKDPEQRLYSGPPIPIGVLLEGRFTSNFRNRIPPELSEAKEIGFMEYSEPTSMIIVTDGDIIRNQYQIPGGQPLPLGFDQFTGITYGNKEFLLNALNYLTDGPSLVSLRQREVRLRELDQMKIGPLRIAWQLLNLLAPVILVLAAGFLLIWVRKDKYTSIYKPMKK